MNRPIEYRAMRADTKKWVFGYLAERDVINVPIYDEATGYHGYDDVLIIPETVGQFTGLLDRNGKKIFEGDIVSAWSEGYNHKGEVRWRMEGQPAIIIYPAFANQGFWKLHADKQGVDDGVEVIGTIHDKPEKP